MSYSVFLTGPLSQGASVPGSPWSNGNTFVNTTWTFEWSDPTDSSATAMLYGSTDGGSTWFVLGSVVSGSPSPQFFTGKPINQVKVMVLAAASGNTLTSQIAGL